MLHHIRRSILDKLAAAPVKRYGELKPAELDGNVFTYHIKALVVEGYVTKTTDGDYSLTPRGRDYIVRRYEDSVLSAHSIYLIVLKVGDKWLLRERRVQPLIGLSGFIHGEPVHNEDILSAASKRLVEKTGLSSELKIRASGLIKIFKASEMQSFSHAIILSGEISELNEENFIQADETGENFLAAEDELPSLHLLPSCLDILDILSSDQTWFELSYDID